MINRTNEQALHRVGTILACPFRIMKILENSQLYLSSSCRTEDPRSCFFSALVFASIRMDMNVWVVRMCARKIANAFPSLSQ